MTNLVDSLIMYHVTASMYLRTVTNNFNFHVASKVSS